LQRCFSFGAIGPYRPSFPLLVSEPMAALRAQGGLWVRDRRLVGSLLAFAVFALSWYCLGHWWYAHSRIVDTPFYQGYGLQMRLGALPYRDFSLDYPPGALPAFLVPTYFGQPTVFTSYATWFGRLMLLCGLGCLVFLVFSRASWRAIAAETNSIGQRSNRVSIR
jgi:hypothetical protein